MIRGMNGLAHDERLTSGEDFNSFGYFPFIEILNRLDVTEREDLFLFIMSPNIYF